MAEPIKFTELTNAGELSLSAIMAIVQQQAGELVSLQCSMAQVAELVASGATYQELTTEQKTLISAINEIAAGGGGGGGAYFFAEGQATAAQIRERYNSGLMCFLIANDDTIYPLTAVDAEYIQGERVEGVFFAKAFGYGDNISVNVKYIQNDAGVEVSSVGFTGIANSRITNDMSATNGKIPTDGAVRAYVTEYIRTRLAQKLDLDLNNISAAGEQKIRDIAGGGAFELIADVTTEEQTTAVLIDFGKEIKEYYVVLTFPSAMSRCNFWIGNEYSVWSATSIIYPNFRDGFKYLHIRVSIQNKLLVADAYCSSTVSSGQIYSDQDSSVYAHYSNIKEYPNATVSKFRLETSANIPVGTNIKVYGR